jgi:ATP-dependent RNA helicase DeaD
MDHLERGSLQLDAIQLIVLDEADRMLDMGFRDDIASILQQVPAERQTAFFSATMPSSVEQLVKRYTRNPEWVRLETRAEAAPNIEQVYYEVAHSSRSNALCRILESSDLRFGIVFCATKNTVDTVSEQLMSAGYRADRLHGDMSQAMRERVLNRFRDRKLEFLVATDVAARGIDVDDVEAVINYDLPRDAEDYVHRIGRTGRAGRSGKAISLATAREVYTLRRIQRLTQVQIRRENVPSAAAAAQFRAQSLTQKTIALLQSANFTPDTQNISLLSEQPYPKETIIGALLHLLVNGNSVQPSQPNPADTRTSSDGTETRAPRNRDFGYRDGGPRARQNHPRSEERAEPRERGPREYVPRRSFDTPDGQRRGPYGEGQAAFQKKRPLEKSKPAIEQRARGEAGRPPQNRPGSAGKTWAKGRPPAGKTPPARPPRGGNQPSSPDNSGAGRTQRAPKDKVSRKIDQ